MTLKIVVANSNAFGDLQPFGEFSISLSEMSAIREVSWVGLRAVAGGGIGAASLSGHMKIQAKFVKVSGKRRSRVVAAAFCG